MKKVIVVTNIPNPYRIPLFNEMWRQCNDHKIEFKVIFGAQNYARRKFVLDMNDCLFPYEILDSRKLDFGNNEKIVFTYKGLLKSLAKEHANCIIINGFSVGTLRLWWRSLYRKTPYVIWSGTVKSRGDVDPCLPRLNLLPLFIPMPHRMIPSSTPSVDSSPRTNSPVRLVSAPCA